MHVQALVAKAAVERFHEGIVGRLPRSTEVQRHAVLVRSTVERIRDELRPIPRRKTHDSRQSRLATAFRDDREATVRKHPFVGYGRKRQGFPKPRLPSDFFWNLAAEFARLERQLPPKIDMQYLVYR
jgi:hypothetical protein